MVRNTCNSFVYYNFFIYHIFLPWKLNFVKLWNSGILPWGMLHGQLGSLHIPLDIPPQLSSRRLDHNFYPKVQKSMQLMEQCTTRSPLSNIEYSPCLRIKSRHSLRNSHRCNKSSWTCCYYPNLVWKAVCTRDRKQKGYLARREARLTEVGSG